MLVRRVLSIPPKPVSALSDAAADNLRRGKGAKAAVDGARAAAATEKWSLDVLVQAKKLADGLGGIDKAREALAALAKLS